MNLAEQAGLGACAAYDGATKAYWGKALYSIGIIEAGIAMTGLASELAGALAGALELSESTASGILARGLLEASLSDMKEAALSTLDGRPWDGKASETAAIDKLASAGITATATTVLQYGLHSSEETLAQVTGWWSNLSRAISMAKEIARADWRELLRLAAEMNSAEAAMHAAWKRFIASRKVYQSRCAKCRRRDKDPDAPTNGNGAGSSKSVGAFDPNAKIGPAGFGAGGFVDLDQPLAYAIYFENEEGATAAARRASIADELDANLDWTTFEVGEVAFGSHLVAVPGGSKHYETSLPIDGWTWNETQGWHTGETPPIVDIVCDLDAGSGQATWPITCIDPNTGLPPETPYAGFVPPNGAANQDPRGEGHADYLVRAKAGLATGTQITNQASIVFDYNPPVATPTTLHTIDPGTPTSNVTALPTTTSTYPFAISWTGQDEAGGSGIATFDIYVSVDNGPFALWLSTTDTSGSFNGQPGHSYAFYSIAADNVGHVEAPPATVDASITIPISKPVAPTLGAVTATTVALADLGGGNVGSVPHAVFEEITSKYVGADGMLTAQPLWRSMDDWAGTVVWGGLTPQTEYHFRSKAQLFDTTETELGDTLIAITSLQGDANGDGEITGADKQAVQAAMGSSPGQQNWDPRADLNGDHNVTEADLRLVQLTRFDSGRDGDVDQSDFSHFQVCWTGPIQGNMRGGCGDVDFNDDGQVDQADLDLFEQCASGPGTAINPGCMD